MKIFFSALPWENIWDRMCEAKCFESFVGLMKVLATLVWFTANAVIYNVKIKIKYSNLYISYIYIYNISDSPKALKCLQITVQGLFTTQNLKMFKIPEVCRRHFILL